VILVAMAIAVSLAMGFATAFVVLWMRVIGDAADHMASIVEHRRTMQALKRTVRGN
jgi:hypothetical protein